MAKKLSIKQPVLSENDQRAAVIHTLLEKTKTYSINVMASPGAGKTTLIEQTIKKFLPDYHICIIEGDVVDIDVKRLEKHGVDVILANTGGACHLDAVMIEKALKKIDIPQYDLLIIENVGNLICPANFAIGTHANIVIASIPEGDDKPYKYPAMFQRADVVLLNKYDYVERESFDVDRFSHGVTRLSPDVAILPVIAKEGKDVHMWYSWLASRLNEKMN